MKKIEFTYLNKKAYDACVHPMPSKKNMPEWFLNMTNYENNEKNLIVENMSANYSAKKCTPMFDAMVSGYTIHLWDDVFVNNNGEEINLSWESDLNIFIPHGPSSSDITTPPGYFGGVAFKFISWLRINTPKGYSIAVQPPSGHYDLPFLCIPAILDTDTKIPDLSFPGWIREDFSGVIKKGTPLVQVLPFKRDDWKSSFSYIDDMQHIYDMDKGFGSTIVNHYKKNNWSKKTFK